MKLKGDSYVLESNIHFPVDLIQLWDSNRKVSSILLSMGSELSGHRQISSLQKRIKKQYSICSRIHRLKGKNYKERLQAPLLEYLRLSHLLSAKASSSLSDMRSLLVLMVSMNQTGLLKRSIQQISKLINDLSHYLSFLDRCTDLVDRRLIQGEQIAHQDKVLSIFEPEVEWISKGKAGKSVEFGHRHLIYSDQYDFILHHQVLCSQTDKELALSAVEQLYKNYGKTAYHYSSLSYDKGFYSLPAKQALEKYFDKVIMPKPGKKTKTEAEQERQASYIELRHSHSAVESNINSLEHTGLDKCPDRGLKKFKQYAATGVLAYNLRQLGKWLDRLEEQQEEKSQKPKNKAKRAA